MGVWVKQKSASGIEVVVTDQASNYIFLGRTYTIKTVESTYATGNNYYIFNAVNNDIVLRPPSFTSTSGPIVITYYTKSDYTGGTAVPYFNRNQLYKTGCACTFTKDPTGTDVGDSLGQLLLGSSASMFKTGAGAVTDDDIVIIGAGEHVLFEVNNLSGATIDYFGAVISWYE